MRLEKLTGHTIFAHSRPDIHQDSKAFASLFFALSQLRISAKESAKTVCPVSANPKKYFYHLNRLILYLSCCIFFLSSTVFALEVPHLQGYVNDYAGIISPQAKTELENELRAFEQTDSTQIVILTISSLEGEALEEFSIRVADSWKIGQKYKDNGIILLVGHQERKIRIEVGRGLEGRLTDLMAGRIIDLVLKPRFKRGDFDGGFIAGVHALIDATRGEFQADERRNVQKPERISQFLSLLVFGTIMILMLGSMSRVMGGISGAVGLPVLAKMIFPVGIILTVILAIVGLIAGLLIPSIFSSGRLSRRGGAWPGGGINWGGGGVSGGGDFGGGFSGGGGGFGGGGASGGW
jgi:uncharacterized protein